MDFKFKSQDYPNLFKDENGWKNHCLKEFDKQYFTTISSEIKENNDIYEGELDVYPPMKLVFNAFELTPLQDVKVVLIGQDPYIRANQAMGLAFSVAKGIRTPPSLKNVYKELVRDPDVEFTMPKHGDLTEWAKQGVLLLNITLTEHDFFTFAIKFSYLIIFVPYIFIFCLKVKTVFCFIQHCLRKIIKS